MKIMKNQLIVTMLAVFCIAMPIVVGSAISEAADTATYEVVSYSLTDATESATVKNCFDNNVAPTAPEGYLFSGWYAADDQLVEADNGEAYFEGNPLSTLDGYTSDTVKALFVDENILGVKAQIAIADADANSQTGVLDDESDNTYIRFVTSIDTNKYQAVGFDVSYVYNKNTITRSVENDYIYEKLMVADGMDGDGEDTSVSPTSFSAHSQYFKACNMSGIPKEAFETGFSVTPYWKTADGTKVTGTTETKSFQQGINATYEAYVDTANTYYKVLETAVNAVNDTEANTAIVTLFKDAEIDTDALGFQNNANTKVSMKVTGKVTLQNYKGTKITISKAKDAIMFDVYSGATFSIVGTDDMDSIVLDGEKLSSSLMMIYSKGTLAIENATMQNSLTTAEGGVIAANAGRLEVTNSKFYNNSGAQGGAIKTYKTTAEITDCEFLENQATTGHGGAIWHSQKNYVLTVKNSKFDSNHTVKNDKHGGAIAVTVNGKLNLYAKNDEGISDKAEFVGNYTHTTKGNGGAIYITNGNGLTVDGYTFTNNRASYIGGAIMINSNATITNATFNGNYTTGGTASAHGGAVYIAANKTVSISSSAFNDNYTSTADDLGGAVYVAGTLNEESNTYSGNYDGGDTTNVTTVVYPAAE